MAHQEFLLSCLPLQMDPVHPFLLQQGKQIGKRRKLRPLVARRPLRKKKGAEGSDANAAPQPDGLLFGIDLGFLSLGDGVFGRVVDQAFHIVIQGSSALQDLLELQVHDALIGYGVAGLGVL